MNTVYKYPLVLTDHQTISMPAGSRLLHVGEQRRELFVWALVDTDEQKTELRTFWIHGTGHDVGDLAGSTFKDYVGTVLAWGDALVWHVFTTVEAGPAS